MSQAGVSYKNPCLIFLDAQMSNSIVVTSPALFSIVELRVKKQFLLSMRLLNILAVDSCK
jgi:hypothetical protein